MSKDRINESGMKWFDHLFAQIEAKQAHNAITLQSDAHAETHKVPPDVKAFFVRHLGPFEGPLAAVNYCKDENNSNHPFGNPTLWPEYIDGFANDVGYVFFDCVKSIEGHEYWIHISNFTRAKYVNPITAIRN